MFVDVYRNRKVLVTGDTGFKGSWLCAWLLELGADVAGFSLDIPTNPSHFQILGLENRISHFTGDVRDPSALAQCFHTVQLEIVFHLAAQALVRSFYADLVSTIATNAMGTLHILEASLRASGSADYQR